MTDRVMAAVQNTLDGFAISSAFRGADVAHSLREDPGEDLANRPFRHVARGAAARTIAAEPHITARWRYSIAKQDSATRTLDREFARSRCGEEQARTLSPANPHF